MISKKGESTLCVPTLQREYNTMYTDRCHSVPHLQFKEVLKPMEKTVPGEVCMDKEEQERCSNHPIEVCKDKIEEESQQEELRIKCSRKPKEMCEPLRVKCLDRSQEETGDVFVAQKVTEGDISICLPEHLQ